MATRSSETVKRIMIGGTALAVMLLCWGLFDVPDWAVAGFVLVVLIPLAACLSVERIRVERRLARSLWLAVTRKMTGT